MYQVYIKTESGFNRKKLGEFKDIEKAHEIIEAELAKDENLEYVIEETTGSVDIYGEMTTRVVEEN